MVLHISLLLSIFAAEGTRRQTGGAVTKQELQAMSDWEADASHLSFKRVP